MIPLIVPVLKRVFLQFFLSILLFQGIFCSAEENFTPYNWPRFRGPNGDGISGCTHWDPTMIENELKIIWKTNVGAGYSNVILKGKLIYTLGNKNGEDTVYCMDSETGMVYWEFTYPCPTKGFYPGTRTTPFFDNGRLYTVSREGHIFCLDIVTGTVIWKRHYVKDFHAPVPTWGFSGSPVIRGDILYLNVCRNGIALDKYTGNIIWVSPGRKCGYTTPVFCTLDGTDSVLIFSDNALFAIEPLTGEVLWKYPWNTDWGANTADPLVFGNNIFISSYYGMGCVCLKIKDNTPFLSWQGNVMNSHFPNFIYQHGFIYGNDGTAGKGSYRCIDPDTGKVMWSKKLGFGTLTATDKHLLFLTELGHLSIAEIDPYSYKEIAKTRIKGGIFFTEPILCNGLLFIRERKGMLFCINVKKSD